MSSTPPPKNVIDYLPVTMRTIQRSQEYLLSIQYPEGFWWAELETNQSMEAEFIMLNHFLGTVDEAHLLKVGNYIEQKQREDGTWGQFYDAPGDLSTSTECYFALKLLGISDSAPNMKKAREFILSKGGVPACRVFTKIWLALFGQWDWSGIPVMPPEIILAPKWLPFNIYEFSSWARATVIPLTVVLDEKPITPIPDSAKIDELYPVPRDHIDYTISRPMKGLSWESFFLIMDKLLKPIDKIRWRPTRSLSLKRAETWILEHQESNGDWGGIQPPWVYSLLALKTLGYPTDHPVMKKGLSGFDMFSIERKDTVQIQACISPQWDTCLAMTALIDSGLSNTHPSIIKAGEWLLAKQVMQGGDWQMKTKTLSPGGWSFEFDNTHYPDIDDTAEVLMALNRVAFPNKAKVSEALTRGVQWTIGMQSKNGGWASFDKDNDKIFLAKIPFSDFGETIDPPSVDVTAHVLEMLGRFGYKDSHPAVASGLKYVLSEQEEDGPWFGRWGVNYIYGTAAVLPALNALNQNMASENVLRAVRWVISCQNDDGGWGESCSSYADQKYKGTGPSTASQTAWAMLSLLAAGEGANEALARGAIYLSETQLENGSWNEPYFTGAGFPGYGIGKRPGHYLKPEDQGYQGPELSAGVMINYHMYRNYWPLSALGRYAQFLRSGAPPIHTHPAGVN